MSIKQSWDFPSPRSKGEQAVNDALEFIGHETDKVIPLEEGTLQRSKEIHQDGLKGLISYNTPYAVKQHEDRTLQHQGNRKAKYLESTVKQNKKKVRDYLAKNVEDAF